MAIMGFSFRLRTAAMVMASMSLQQGSVAGVDLEKVLLGQKQAELQKIQPKDARQGVKKLNNHDKLGETSELWKQEKTATFLVLGNWNNLEKAKRLMKSSESPDPSRVLERAAVRSYIYEKTELELSDNEAEAILRQVVPKLNGTDDDAAWDDVSKLIEDSGINNESIKNARQYIQKMKGRFDTTFMAAIGLACAAIAVTFLLILVAFLYSNDDINASPLFASALAGDIALYVFAIIFGIVAWFYSRKATSSADNLSQGLEESAKAREQQRFMGLFNFQRFQTISNA